MGRKRRRPTKKYRGRERRAAARHNMSIEKFRQLKENRS